MAGKPKTVDGGRVSRKRLIYVIPPIVSGIDYNCNQNGVHYDTEKMDNSSEFKNGN
jgi:hypothetical protein